MTGAISIHFPLFCSLTLNLHSNIGRISKLSRQIQGTRTQFSSTFNFVISIVIALALLICVCSCNISEQEQAANRTHRPQCFTENLYRLFESDQKRDLTVEVSNINYLLLALVKYGNALKCTISVAEHSLKQCGFKIPVWPIIIFSR